MKIKPVCIIAAVIMLFAAWLACAEVSVELPWQLASVREQAFYQDAAVYEVVLGENVTRIESKAFAGSGLKYINLPGKIEYIAPDAFDDCTDLQVSCSEDSYAHQYCAGKNIPVADPPLVLRVLGDGGDMDFARKLSEGIDQALQSAADTLDQRLRTHFVYAYNADRQDACVDSAALRGADMVVIDLVDAGRAHAYAQTLQKAGIPVLFVNTEPDPVENHAALFVGCSGGKRADPQKLAETSAAIAVNFLRTGKWLDGLDYASEDDWAVYLEPGLRLSGVKIGIDPGHQRYGNSEKELSAPGGSTKKAKVSSGTTGVATKTAEYIRNLEISLQLRDALTALGAEVYMTRETHYVNISNQERAKMMNNLGVDLVLRIHCNGSTNQSAHGIGLYVNPTNYYAPHYPDVPAQSYRAAQYLLPAMVRATGAKSCGIYKRDSYTGMNWSTVPSILVEMGFMTNPDEDRRLADPAYQKKLVIGMVDGICQYMGR